jgi:hypothetical protein
MTGCDAAGHKRDERGARGVGNARDADDAGGTGATRGPIIAGGGSSPSERAFVLDTSALLSYLRGDRGGALVQRVLQQCRDCETRMAISASHLLEAYETAARDAPDLLDDLISLVDQLPLDVCPLTEETVEAVAHMVASSPDLKPELGAALALSSENGATLVTADPDMAGRPGCLYVGSGSGPGTGPGIGSTRGNQAR